MRHYATKHASAKESYEGRVSQRIQHLKMVNLNLSREVRLLDQLLAKREEKDPATTNEDEPKDVSHRHQLPRDDVRLLAGNSKFLFQHCEKLVDNLKVKMTVAKQVLLETKRRMEQLEKEEDNLAAQRKEVVRRGVGVDTDTLIIAYNRCFFNKIMFLQPTWLSFN